MSVAPALVVDLGAAFTKIGFAGNLTPCMCCATVVREFGCEAALADRVLGTLGVDASDPSAVSALLVVESSAHALGGSGAGGGAPQQQPRQNHRDDGDSDSDSDDGDGDGAAGEELAEAAFEALGVQALRVEPAAPCALLGFQLLAAWSERQGRPGTSGGGAVGAGRQPWQQQQQRGAAAAAAVAARLDSLAAAVQAATATGLVIDAGAESTRIVPVVDGYALAAAAIELPPVAAMAADERERRRRRRPHGQPPVGSPWGGGSGSSGGFGQEDGGCDDDVGRAVAAVVAEAVDAAVCCAPVDARRALLAGVVLTGGGGAGGGRGGGGGGGALLSRRAVEAAVAKAARARMGPGAKPLDACAVRDPSPWGHAAWAGASALAALWSSEAGAGGKCGGGGGGECGGGGSGGGARGSSWGGGVVEAGSSLEAVCVTRQAYEELGAWRAGALARANAAVLRGLPMLF